MLYLSQDHICTYIHRTCVDLCVDTCVGVLMYLFILCAFENLCVLLDDYGLGKNFGLYEDLLIFLLSNAMF